MRLDYFFGFIAFGLLLSFPGWADIDRPGPRDERVCYDYAAQKRKKEELWHIIYALKEQKVRLENLKPLLPEMYENARLIAEASYSEAQNSLSILHQLEGRRLETVEALNDLSKAQNVTSHISKILEVLMKTTGFYLDSLLLELRFFLIHHQDLVKDQILYLEAELERHYSEDLEFRLQATRKLLVLPNETTSDEPLEKILNRLFTAEEISGLSLNFNPFVASLIKAVQEIAAARVYEGNQLALELRDQWKEMEEQLGEIKLKWQGRAIDLEFRLSNTLQECQRLQELAATAAADRDAAARRMGTIDTEISNKQHEINIHDDQWRYWDKNPPTCN